MVPSASFASRAIDIDLAQQIKESQSSEAKATSWSLLVNTGCRRYQRGREPLPTAHGTRTVLVTQESGRHGPAPGEYPASDAAYPRAQGNVERDAGHLADAGAKVSISF
jgi:hypothetical protein